MDVMAPSRAALWSSRLGPFALVLFVLSAIGHRYGLIETVAFLWLLALGFSLAFVALILSVAGLRRLWIAGAPGGKRAAAGGVLALVVLAPFAVSAWRAVTLPQLFDVSTDTLAPPPLLASEDTVRPTLRRAGGMASQEQLARYYPAVNGRRYALAPETVARLVEELAAARGWRVVARRGSPVAPAGLLIMVAARSYLLRFPTTVTIRIVDDGEATAVDMRSASLHGAHDLGDNAERIVRFLSDLDLRTAGAPIDG